MQPLLTPCTLSASYTGRLFSSLGRLELLYAGAEGAEVIFELHKMHGDVGDEIIMNENDALLDSASVRTQSYTVNFAHNDTQRGHQKRVLIRLVSLYPKSHYMYYS